MMTFKPEFISELLKRNNSRGYDIIGTYVTSLLLFAMLTASCSHDKTADLPPYLKATDIVEISGDSILINARESILNMAWMYEVGDTLIFYDDDDEYNYSIVSLNSDSVICRAGARGEGPGQLLGQSRTQIDSQGRIYIYDDQNQTMLRYQDVDQFISGPDSVPSIRFKDMSGGRLYKSLNGYVGDNLYGNGKIFTFFDNDGTAVTTFGLVPGTETRENVNPDFYMSYQVIFAMSPDKRYICAAGAFHDWLAFFDVSGDTPRLLKEYYSVGPVLDADGKDEQFHLKLRPETVKHFKDITPFADGVYLTYIGATNKSMKSDRDDYSTHILKYNWNGELQGVFHPDEKLLYIGAAPSGDILYGVSTSEDGNHKILRYDMTKK